MTLSSWLIFNQPPDVGFYIGAPIVIGSGLYIWWRERAMARSVTTISEASDTPAPFGAVLRRRWPGPIFRA
ncbi:MAG: hypothetical protein HY371_04860 [Devosia nanyangense]|nr:hypothetical protein [Devosia nanyangense]